MALGPGKYDDLCTYVREQTGTDADGAAVVIVVGGHRGSGFSVQAGPHMALVLPGLLEEIAKQMRADLLGGRDG